MSVGKATGKKKKDSTPVQTISSVLAGNSLIRGINSPAIRTAWIWVKGDNPLSPRNPKRAKIAKTPKPKTNWLRLKREHKPKPAQITEGDEPAEPANVGDPDALSEED